MPPRTPPPLNHTAWAKHLGSALAEPDVARLLAKSQAEVSVLPDLLRLVNQDGQTVYPLLQFDQQGGVLPGLGELLQVLQPALLPLTIASWLMTAQTALNGRTPRQALADGDSSDVLRLARAVASTQAG